jgi:hypothetical protein
MPKRKEQEALFFEDVDEFRSELIEKGGRLAAVIAPTILTLSAFARKFAMCSTLSRLMR